MSYKKIGVVIADIEEYTPLTKIAREIKDRFIFGIKGVEFKVGDSDVYAAFCGIGKVNAATAAAFLVSYGAEIILNYGLSGGISGVKKGELIVPTTFIEHDFDLTGIGYKPSEKPWQDYIYKADEKLSNIIGHTLSAKVGSTAVCGDSFICDDETRRHLRENFKANSCDMETAAIASVCHRANIPFATLRRISDNAGEDAGTDYRELNNNEGETLVASFVKALEAIVESEVGYERN
ncbi:MAG: 5'-methylthioadenosine/S-adenosylhomocysteine nucleosidase [Clostridia bacterium]|nr:5'-methylthioadenosine/S-adenosylhomocysteine nucleosidase [Clostridia bacterium]